MRELTRLLVTVVLLCLMLIIGVIGLDVLIQQQVSEGRILINIVLWSVCTVLVVLVVPWTIWGD